MAKITSKLIKSAAKGVIEAFLEYHEDDFNIWITDIASDHNVDPAELAEQVYYFLDKLKLR